jgi:hypothetical protein
MATSLARRASSLAAEVQQRATVPTSAPEPAAPAPVPVSSSPEAEQPEIPIREEAPEAPAVPEVTAAPPPVSPAHQERLSRLTVVRGTAEYEAVQNALVAGQRFAQIQGVLVVDTEANRMWQAQLMSVMTHAAAVEKARELGTGGYRDWRLPTVEELHALFAQNGLEGLRSLGVLPAMSAPFLWTSKVRSRFFGFRKEGAVFHSGTGELTYRKMKDSSVRMLAVRSA